jgi:hypothetical protein
MTMREVVLEPSWMDREVKAARETIAALPKALRDQTPLARAKAAEIAMTTDTQRLDWMSTATVEDNVELGFEVPTGRHIVSWSDYHGDLHSVESPHGLRAAIDAAMMRESKGG